MKWMNPKYLFLLAGIALGGCAGMSGDSAGRSTGAAPPNELIASVQLPGGSKIDHNQSLIMGSGENWVGRVVLEVPNSSVAYTFFLEQYPPQGWVLVSAVRGKTSLLVFTKADRSATIEMAEGSMLGSAMATLTVSPKNALPPVPARKP